MNNIRILRSIPPACVLITSLQTRTIFDMASCQTLFHRRRKYTGRGNETSTYVRVLGSDFYSLFLVCDNTNASCTHELTHMYVCEIFCVYINVRQVCCKPFKTQVSKQGGDGAVYLPVQFYVLCGTYDTEKLLACPKGQGP